MATPEDLDALQCVADRSFAGEPMSTAAVIAGGIDAGAVHSLELEGLVEVVDHDGVPTVVLTDSGLGVLRPRNSA